MSILQEILAAKRGRVAGLRRERPWASLEQDALYGESRRSLARALRRAGPDTSIGFLCEIKRASPSAGLIRIDADAVTIGQAYRDAGAAGLSLVTEESFFLGRPQDLPRLRPVGLPILMKDFFVDPYQVVQARSLGADVVLLIAAVDDAPLLQELRATARELGLEVLVEVHHEAECELAAALAPELIGVNHRDLRSFEIDLSLSERLWPRLLEGPSRLAESGIRSRADVLHLERLGYDGLLVGESLLRAPDPGQELRQLRGVREDGSRPANESS